MSHSMVAVRAGPKRGAVRLWVWKACSWVIDARGAFCSFPDVRAACELICLCRRRRRDRLVCPIRRRLLRRPARRLHCTAPSMPRVRRRCCSSCVEGRGPVPRSVPRVDRAQQRWKEFQSQVGRRCGPEGTHFKCSNGAVTWHQRTGTRAGTACVRRPRHRRRPLPSRWPLWRWRPAAGGARPPRPGCRAAARVPPWSTPVVVPHVASAARTVATLRALPSRPGTRRGGRGRGHP